jgi:hypothetical protein
MLVWQGLGAYGFVIPFFLLVGAQLVASALLGDDGAVQYGDWVTGLTLLLSAVLVHFIAMRLAARPGREVIDKATGEEITLRERHTLFFVPLRYWAILYAVLGAVILGTGISASLV